MNANAITLKRLSSLIILADVANLTIYIAKCVHYYFHFTLQLPCWRWLGCDCKHIV